MENFNINITVNDYCYNKCNCNNNSTTKVFTNTNEFLTLQCNYFFKIITVTNTYVILSIDNGILHFVRRAFIGIPLKICLPNNCSTHIITITLNSITV